MENINFTEIHYNAMVAGDEDYKALSFDQLRAEIERGSRIVAKNKGFQNLDKILNEKEMVSVGAFIDFRTAKRNLGETVREID